MVSRYQYTLLHVDLMLRLISVNICWGQLGVGQFGFRFILAPLILKLTKSKDYNTAKN